VNIKTSFKSKCKQKYLKNSLRIDQKRPFICGYHAIFNVILLISACKDDSFSLETISHLPSFWFHFSKMKKKLLDNLNNNSNYLWNLENIEIEVMFD
jgi:hypothetical protein